MDDAKRTHPHDWMPPIQVGLWARMRAAFAWKMVKDSGVWVYYENAITGERKALDKGGCWQPIDYLWLAERNGRSVNRFGEVTYF